MDFFERQQIARRNTRVMVVCFVLAVICVVGVQTVRRRSLARPLTERLARLAPSGADALSPPS